MLQSALMLEHATIPLYLTALYSLVPNTNQAVAKTLKDIVLEEMGHFMIVANVLNALGGRPLIDDEKAVPIYPDVLPMGVAGGPKVYLRQMSIEQCKVFMTIEEPEEPIARRAHPDVTTIGDFYRAIIKKIGDLGQDAFKPSSAALQVTSPLVPEFEPVTDADSAINGLNIIVEQGEGTATSPLEAAGATKKAHFYRFAEIVHGGTLVPDPTAPSHFSWNTKEEPVPFDATKVLPMAPPIAVNDLKDSNARRLATDFCSCYRKLLMTLQTAFTGHPELIGEATDVMDKLGSAARAMLATPDPIDPTRQLTPSWEYLKDPM